MSLEDNSYDSDAVAFKNTGVYTTSITMSGTVASGATKTVTSVVTLDEDQDFAYAIANYKNYYSNLFSAESATYQVMPTFEANLPSSPNGLVSALFFKINGDTVTFTAFTKNDGGVTETITSTTYDIIYVTYRTDS